MQGNAGRPERHDPLRQHRQRVHGVGEDPVRSLEARLRCRVLIQSHGELIILQFRVCMCMYVCMRQLAYVYVYMYICMYVFTPKNVGIVNKLLVSSVILGLILCVCKCVYVNVCLHSF